MKNYIKSLSPSTIVFYGFVAIIATCLIVALVTAACQVLAGHYNPNASF